MSFCIRILADFELNSSAKFVLFVHIYYLSILDISTGFHLSLQYERICVYFSFSSIDIWLHLVHLLSQQSVAACCSWLMQWPLGNIWPGSQPVNCVCRNAFV